MSKRLLASTFDSDYDGGLETDLTLQERAQYSPDAQEANRVYLALAGETPRWQ